MFSLVYAKEKSGPSGKLEEGV
ncbi:hypothetical protein MASSI9I_10293 [Massilia sp. 9I]|nr:hypothetical protein MASSI9I_10293 [Massilia sp. 9I]